MSFTDLQTPMHHSPAYNPRTNLILTGDVDWCTTVKLQTKEEVLATPEGQFWVAEGSINPFNEFGKFARADGHWARRTRPRTFHRICCAGRQ